MDIVNLIGILILFAPFVVILFFANLAERRREGGAPGTEFAVLSYLFLLLIYCFLIIVGLIIQLMGMVAQSSQAANLGVDTSAFTALGGVGPALWIPSVFGILLLLPPLRRLLARAIPIDPASSRS